MEALTVILVLCMNTVAFASRRDPIIKKPKVYIDIINNPLLNNDTAGLRNLTDDIPVSNLTRTTSVNLPAKPVLSIPVRYDPYKHIIQPKETSRDAIIHRPVSPPCPIDTAVKCKPCPTVPVFLLQGDNHSSASEYSVISGASSVGSRESDSPCRQNSCGCCVAAGDPRQLSNALSWYLGYRDPTPASVRDRVVAVFWDSLNEEDRDYVFNRMVKSRTFVNYAITKIDSMSILLNQFTTDQIRSMFARSIHKDIIYPMLQGMHPMVSVCPGDISFFFEEHDTQRLRNTVDGLTILPPRSHSCPDIPIRRYLDDIVLERTYGTNTNITSEL